MRRGYLAALGLAGAGLLSLTAPVSAQYAVVQTPGQPQGDGIQMGSFRFYPILDLGVSYDTNVYRTPTGVKSDVYFSEVPSFSLQSQWSRHQFDLFGMFAGFQYASLTHENHEDWNLGGDGRLDIYRGIDLKGGGSYAVMREQRVSPDQPGVAKYPTEFAVGLFNAAIDYHPYQFGFTLGGNIANYDYQTTQIISGPPINNTDRNRSEDTLFAKASYEFSPGYAVYGQVNYRDVSYQLKFDRSGLQRDNSGYSGNVGVDMLVTNLVKGQIFVGYMNEHYHAPLVDVSGFNFGANVDWTASALWTVHLTASRALNGTTLNGASTEDDQAVRLGVDYAPMVDLTVNAHIGYTSSTFSGLTRQDDYVDAGLGAVYVVSRTVNLYADYRYSERSSNVTGQGFTDNVFSVGLNWHL